jgi:hypothetical protein
VRLPRTALGWWLGSAVVYGTGVALFDDLVYGGPLKSGYPPGLIMFSLSAVSAQLPLHARAPDRGHAYAGPRGWRPWCGSPGGERGGDGQAASQLRPPVATLRWASPWPRPGPPCGGSVRHLHLDGLARRKTLQVVRLYVPAIGAISLLGAWLLVRVPRRTPMAALTSAAVVVAMFGLGAWSYASMRA